MVLTATLLSQQLPTYTQQIEKYLPHTCPRCSAENHLILDADDPSYAYCWAHFGEVFIGTPHELTEKGYNHHIGPNVNTKLFREGKHKGRRKKSLD